MNLKSVKALTVVVIICMVLAAVLAVGAPWLIPRYAYSRGISPTGTIVTLISFYLCLIPASIVFVTMMQLLRRIRQKHPFDPKNPTYIRIISWCCLAVAVITGVGGVWYPPLFFVCGAMAFLFLVVQVVASCFKAAVLLQEENDLTI